MASCTCHGYPPMVMTALLSSQRSCPSVRVTTHRPQCTYTDHDRDQPRQGKARTRLQK